MSYIMILGWELSYSWPLDRSHEEEAVKDKKEEEEELSPKKVDLVKDLGTKWLMLMGGNSVQCLKKKVY